MMKKNSIGAQKKKTITLIPDTNFLTGKLLSGFLSLCNMFYNSNLRQALLVKEYDPEINSEEDIIKYNIETIYSPSRSGGIHLQRI